MPPRVRVVVIDYDGADVLPLCLESLAGSVDSTVPISVLDNASPFPSKALIPESLLNRIDLIQLGKNNGYAGAIAYAWENFSEEFLIIANNDLEFTPGWLEKLIDTAETTGAHAVSAVIDHGTESDLEKSTNASLNPLFYLIKGVFKDRTVAVYPSGACFLLRNDKNIPCPVDPGYFLYYEDAYIGLFLRALDKKVVQCPDSVVKHAGSHSVKRTNPKKIAFYQERNRLLTQVLFLNTRELILIYPCIWYDSFLLPLSCFIRKKPYFTMLSSHWWFTFHWWSVLQKKNALRKIPNFDTRRNYPYLSGQLFPAKIPTSSLQNRLAKWWWRLIGIPVDREAGK